MSVRYACMFRRSSMTVANGSWCQTLGEGSLHGQAWRATVCLETWGEYPGLRLVKRLVKEDFPSYIVV